MSRSVLGAGLHRWSLVFVAVIVLSVGCGSEDTRIALTTVESSEGGNIAALEVMDVDDTPYLVAPTGSDLYVRGVEDESWQRRPARWPMGVDDPGLDVFSAVGRATKHAKFGPENYFAVLDDRLWTIALPAVGQPSELLYSDDLGQSWQEVTPPGDAAAVTGAGIGGQSLLEPAMRLVAADDDLFVFDGQTLWKKGGFDGEIDDGRRKLDWEAVSLAGTVLGGSDDESGDDRLPRQLHHYLPADVDHDYELATIHGRDLSVYRRDTENTEFEKVATLDAVDRDLVREPGIDSVFLVDSRAIYRSDDEGSNWEQIEVARDSLEPEGYRRLKVVEDADAGAGYQLWVSGDNGGLWRSENGGREWTELRERDIDRRGISGLFIDEERDSLWAATTGRGVIRSELDGQRWREANEGLDAASPRDAVLSSPEHFYVGSDAGLYERSTADAESETRLDDRAVRSLKLDDEARRLIAGSAGGGIELYVDGRRQESSRIASVDDTDELVFKPPYMRSTQTERSAILDLVVRPDSQELIAWSHRRGAMVSNDSGESWRRLQFGQAFRRAIEGTVITHFLATRDQTYFAVTEPRRQNRPTQLWRSDDGGSTWQTTYSFRERDYETPMQLVQLAEDRGLLIAYGSRLAVSTDRGATWTSISGPWEGGVTTGLAVDGDQVAVVMDLPHATEIAWIDDPIDDASVAQRHRLGWPTTRSFDVHDPIGLEVRGERVMIHEGDTVYRGEMPRRASGGAGNVSLVVALGAVIALTTLAFGYLRRWEAG